MKEQVYNDPHNTDTNKRAALMACFFLEIYNMCVWSTRLTAARPGARAGCRGATTRVAGCRQAPSVAVHLVTAARPPTSLAPTETMSTQQHVLEQIMNADTSDAQNILSELGLSGLPPRERVLQDIEQKLLLPKEKLPDHWLPKYQV